MSFDGSNPTDDALRDLWGDFREAGRNLSSREVRLSQVLDGNLLDDSLADMIDGNGGRDTMISDIGGIRHGRRQRRTSADVH